MKYNLTLMELLIILVFIGILSMVSLPIGQGEKVHSVEEQTVVQKIQVEISSESKKLDQKI